MAGLLYCVVLVSLKANWECRLLLFGAIGRWKWEALGEGSLLEQGVTMRPRLLLFLSFAKSDVIT